MKFIPFILVIVILAGCYNDKGINFPYPENNKYSNKHIDGNVQQFCPR